MPDKLWEEPLQRGGDFGTIFDAIGTTLATAYSGTGQGAKRIAAELVRRANAYPRLVAALQEVLEEERNRHCDNEQCRKGLNAAIVRARAALAEADRAK
jgi:hypothetical protein